MLRIWAKSISVQAGPVTVRAKAVVVTAGLLAITIVLGWRRGYSVVGLISRSADRAFVGVLRQRFGVPESPSA